MPLMLLELRLVVEDVAGVAEVEMVVVLVVLREVAVPVVWPVKLWVVCWVV